MEKLSETLAKLDQNSVDNFNECVPKENFVHVKITLVEKSKINISNETYICKKCKQSLYRGRMPKLCTMNGLHVDKVALEMKLTELEANLIAKNILFPKFHKKAKSRWSGTHDRLINVPIPEDSILKTVETLPRTPTEAGIVSVKLKRKMEYKGTHMQQIIDSRKFFKYLEFLKHSGNL